MRRAQLESEVQRQIEAAIGAEPDFLLMRNHVGVAKFYGDEGKVRMQKFGLGTGSPDLVGMLRVGPGLSAWVALEVKCPGEEAEPHQAVVHDQWRAFGALVYVVHSAGEARMALATARLAVGMWLATGATGHMAGAT